MLLIINELEIDIVNLNTNFTDYWMNTVFKSNQAVPLNVDNSRLLHLRNNYTQCWNNLQNTLLTVNDIVNKRNLPDRFKYAIANSPSTTFLESTHEQWAQFSKEALEQHRADVYNPDTAIVYTDINAELSNTGMHTDRINNMVHELEFLYRHLHIHQMSLPVQFNYGDYKVTPSDTIFGYNNVVVPFMDIGRPQYEKWCISRHVVHTEISNYDRIINYLDFYSTPVPITPNPEFITQCNYEQVPVWGNVLSIGVANYTNFDAVGYDVVNALVDDNNYIMVKK